MIITADILKKISPRANKAIITDLEQYLAPTLERYEINTQHRVAHFLAQAAHESDGFKTLQEYASGSAYEGRKDLGNVYKGDGVKFKGRGIFQLTGRANYKEMSGRLGVDLVRNPEMAATGKISILTACEYWNARKLSTWADEDDIQMITKRINGGFNGLDDRIARWKIVKSLLPVIFSAPTPPHPDDGPAPVRPDDDPNPVIYQRGMRGPDIRVIQAALNSKGAHLTVDGDYGNNTFNAVVEFQKSLGLEPTGAIDTNLFKTLTEG